MRGQRTPNHALCTRSGWHHAFFPFRPTRPRRSCTPSFSSRSRARSCRASSNRCYPRVCANKTQGPPHKRSHLPALAWRWVATCDLHRTPRLFHHKLGYDIHYLDDPKRPQGDIHQARHRPDADIPRWPGHGGWEGRPSVQSVGVLKMYDDNVQRHDSRPNHVHPLTSIALYNRKKVLGRRNLLPGFSNLVSGWVRRAMASGTPSCRLPPPLRGLKNRGPNLALRNAYFDNIIDACEAGTIFSKRKVLFESGEKEYFPMASPWAHIGAGTRP